MTKDDDIQTLKEELEMYKNLCKQQNDVLKQVKTNYDGGLPMHEIVRRNSQLSNERDVGDKVRIAVDSILKYSKQLNLF